MALSSFAVQQRGELGLEIGQCGSDLCVAWVMPASQGWHGGARPGMRVVALNGGADPAINHGPLVQAELLLPDGRPLAIRVRDGPLTWPWALSLWLTGAVFVLLGAVVLMRRPEAPVARLFALFTGMAGVALGVAPAAGGPHPSWSLVFQFLSLLALAASLPAFAIAFVRPWSKPRIALRLFWLAGCVLLAWYLASLFVRPSLYGGLRVVFLLYLAAGILAGLIVLAPKTRQRSQPSARDARLAFSGIACGALPFVSLTLIPQASFQSDLVPAHLTALLWSLIPVTFAYAILRHQTLGIRRLLHRGMVYGITTIFLLGLMSLLVVAANSFVARFVVAIHPALVTATLLVIAAGLFQPVRKGARRLVDRFLYFDEIDSGTLLAGMRHDLLGSERAEDVVAAMVKRLRDSLQLESIILFLGTTGEKMRIAASAGARADESIGYVRPRLLKLNLGEDGLSEIRWGSDELLIARLETGRDALGFLALGPKERGEVFLGEERRLVETVTPILALAIRQTSLVAELREVSERLTNAQEAERARIARDLHDGPLQKAILLGGAANGSLRDRDGVARELASELRELCARLRPAILDDLGLVPALEWLLEQTAQGFRVTPHLTLRGMTEDDRLAPNAELALFRVTQEAVSNALKHGHASSIHVSLDRTTEAVLLSVADDGSGLDTDHDLAHGLGIPGMRERLRHVGGSVAVASNGSVGTMVTACIPYSVHAEQ